MEIKLLILGDGDTVRRLPEVLAKPGVEIHVSAHPESVFAKSIFVKKFFPILFQAQEEDWGQKNQKLLNFLEESDYDMYIFSNDPLVRRVRDSQISESAKQRILPVKNSEFLSILDSKVGLRNFCLGQSIPFPESEVFDSTEKCFEKFEKNRGRIVIKGDQGHGGTGVLMLNPSAPFPTERVSKLKYPILVQEYLSLKLVAVEALFLNGHLAGYLYSTPLECIGVTGPSTKRIFREPKYMDFVTHLKRIGKSAKLDGFFNTSWFLDEALGRHILFELDARPNAWHQFGPKLGVDWSQLILNPEQPKLQAKTQTKEDKLVSLFPRSFSHALKKMNVGELCRWIFAAPGTWDFASRKDRAVSSCERMELLNFWKAPLTNFAFFGWEKLPEVIRNSSAIKNYLRKKARSIGL